MFEEGGQATLIRRARMGSGRTQAQAARALDLGRATLNVYETGRIVPSERRTSEILSVLALGERASGEQRPRLFVSFSLAGQRLLSIRGALLEFASPQNAARVADELDACRLDNVVVVPAWSSFVDEVLSQNADRPGTSQEVVVFEQLGRPFEDVLDEALRELIDNVRPWLRGAVAAKQQSSAAGGPGA